MNLGSKLRKDTKFQPYTWYGYQIIDSMCSYSYFGARAFTFHNFQDGDGGRLGIRGQDDPQTLQVPFQWFLMPHTVEIEIFFDK